MVESGEKEIPPLALATFCIICHIVVCHSVRVREKCFHSCLDRVLKQKLGGKYLRHTSLKKGEEKKGEEKNVGKIEKWGGEKKTKMFSAGFVETVCLH